APVVGRGLGERRDAGDTRVVDDDVETAQLVYRALHERLDLGVTRDVGRRDDRAASRALDQPRRLLEVGLPAPRQPDAPARPRQRARHRAATPTAGACDDGNLYPEVRQRSSSSIVVLALVG